jgi:flagellar basal body-associated protein FliL
VWFTPKPRNQDSQGLMDCDTVYFRCHDMLPPEAFMTYPPDSWPSPANQPPQGGTPGYGGYPSPPNQPNQPSYGGGGGQTSYGQPPTAPQSGAGYGTPGPAYSPYPPAQPTYGAQPGYQQTPWAVPEPPKKSSAGLVVTIIVIAVLLIGGGVGAALYLSNNKTNGTPTANGTTQGAPTTPPATTPPAPTGDASFNAPPSIGTLGLAADQSTATTLKNQLKSSGITDPFAVAYEDQGNAARRVVLWGGTGADFGGGDQERIDAFFKSGNAEFTGQTVSNRAPVDTGSAGGTAECETVNGGAEIAFCVWVGPKALLGLIFGGYTRATSDALTATVLSAVVHY